MLIFSSCATRQNDQVYLPEWKPNLDQPIRQIEETLAKQERQESLQEPVNFMIANASFLYDAKVYILFHDYVARLPVAKRNVEIAKQSTWLATRKRLMDEAAAEYEGGTLASYVAGQAAIKACKERISEIEEEMKELSTTQTNATSK